MEEVQYTIKFIPDQDRITDNLFQITVYFFLTDTCIGIFKSLGVRKFCPNNKFPDKVVPV